MWQGGNHAWRFSNIVNLILYIDKLKINKSNYKQLFVASTFRFYSKNRFCFEYIICRYFLIHLDMNDGRCGDVRGVGDGESPEEGVPGPAAHAGHPQEYAQEEDFSEVSVWS